MSDTEPGSGDPTLTGTLIPDGNPQNSDIIFVVTINKNENPSGANDEAFNDNTEQVVQPGANNEVLAVDVDRSGRSVIGGEFTSYNGVARNRVARVLTNGRLDNSFNPPPATGANGSVSDLLVITAAGANQDKIVIVGSFSSYNGVARNRIARLNSDGSLDTSFNPGTGANGEVRSLAFDSMGRVLIAGEFTSYNGTGRNRIARLNADGSLDASFNPGTGANATVHTVEVQADDKVLIGGDFTSVDGFGRSRIARLNDDGFLDASFNPGPGMNGPVYDILYENAGTIVAVGNFTAIGSVIRRRIVRLNSDGSIDATFKPGPDDLAPSAIGDTQLGTFLLDQGHINRFDNTFDSGTAGLGSGTMSDGDWVTMTTTGVLPDPFVAGTPYQIINDDDSVDTFQLADVGGANPIRFNSLGSGRHTVRPVSLTFDRFDVDIALETITVQGGHYLRAGDTVRFVEGIATLPMPLIENTDFTVLTANGVTGDFQIDDGAGAPLDITDTGGGFGSFTVQRRVSHHFASADVDAATETITIPGGHNLSNGNAVQFLAIGGGSTLPMPLTGGMTFNILNANQLAGTFQLNNGGGMPLDLTDMGTGAFVVQRTGNSSSALTSVVRFDSGNFDRSNGKDFTSFEVNTATDTITAGGHGLTDGDTVRFDDQYTGTGLPMPLDPDVTFTVLNATTTTFQLDAGGGVPLNLTTLGTFGTPPQPFRVYSHPSHLIVTNIATGAFEGDQVTFTCL